MWPYFLHLLFIDLDSVLWRKIWIQSLLSSSHLVESPILQDEMKRKNGLILQRLCIKLFSAMSLPFTLFYGFLLHNKLLISIKPYNTEQMLSVLVSKIRGFQFQYVQFQVDLTVPQILQSLKFKRFLLKIPLNNFPTDFVRQTLKPT